MEAEMPEGRVLEAFEDALQRSDTGGVVSNGTLDGYFDVPSALDAALLAAAWRPISEAPRDGREVLLGAVGSGDLDFYRWYDDLREEGQPEWYCWGDRASDPPCEEPTHFMLIEPPT